MAVPESSWEEVRFPFTTEVPVWIRPGPDAASPLVVLCHGMGEEPVAATRRWPELLALPVHVLAPAGPLPFELRSESGIRIGHAWYLYDGGEDLFRETVSRSAAWLRNTLDRVERERGWRPERRALVGFSQGAYFGYVAALANPDRFTHLVAVAGRLKESFVADRLAAGGSLATLILQGREDRSVPPDAGRRSHAALTAAGFPATLEVMDAGHRITPGMDARTAAWLAGQGFGP